MRYLRLTAFVLIVLLLAASLAWTAPAKSTASSADITAITAKAPNLSTFAKLVRIADLTSELKKPGPFTVLAPTNEAFGKLPKTTLDSLIKPENKARLRTLLLYHVIQGKHTSAMVIKMHSPAMVKSMQGDMLTITHTNSGVMVNNAKVVKPDITACNGIIHEINAVLIPNMSGTPRMHKGPGMIHTR
jgi:uncharacterized surface protein with fasciclin (FAS1) repeats